MVIYRIIFVRSGVTLFIFISTGITTYLWNHKLFLFAYLYLILYEHLFSDTKARRYFFFSVHGLRTWLACLFV
jgi:hypothetical protein